MPAVDIKIHILDNPATPSQGRHGTFLGPPPKVKVTSGDDVTFTITPAAGYTFAVIFPGLSPFTATSITGPQVPPQSHAAVFPGEYHYQVRVTKTATGESFVIANCPELDVG